MRHILSAVSCLDSSYHCELSYLHCTHCTQSRVYVTVKRPSTRLSVCPIIRPQPRRAAGLLLSVVRTGDRSTAAAASRPAAEPQNGAHYWHYVLIIAILCIDIPILHVSYVIHLILSSCNQVAVCQPLLKSYLILIDAQQQMQVVSSSFSVNSDNLHICA